jgi:hypothetical protein
MLCRLSLAFVMLLVATVSSPTQEQAQGQPQRPPHPNYQGTANDQNACDAPAQKFCRAEIPDQFRVLACLQRNRPNIGKACQAVLSAYGQ